MKSENDKVAKEVEFIFRKQIDPAIKDPDYITVFKDSIQFQRNSNYKGDQKKIPNLAYTITTSGTTGDEKIVRVPFSCILPNIFGLQEIFKLQSEVIYSSAPETFDVFVVDFFLSLLSGSCLLILNRNLKFSSKTLEILFPADKIHHSGVTFMQITPSLMQRWSLDEIKGRVLREDSSLR